MPLNIMIVDDSMLIAKKLSAILIELGHNIVAICGTGKKAVEDYEKYMPDLITMDITMPEMDGIEATKNIKAKHPNALIVMITSHGQEQMVIDAINAGAKGYVLKPFKKEKLEETIDMIIKKYGKNLTS